MVSGHYGRKGSPSEDVQEMDRIFLVKCISVIVYYVFLITLEGRVRHPRMFNDWTEFFC